ncbi:plasmid replication initiation protein [Hymenobacter luteus]|uniref:Plasmid replication initiation protein n=2 Tax=Hymenobacter TaxID=89966 RepID=A0A7W9T4U7_9BACT|nr:MULTISPECIES: replication initiation protein [Hymenobacter]MBB4603773.1 plasmid replication initiation protein [Hymenobacter latericoloratus]MBB6061555.1 plasmid replication initiation protein [Hymenobacter luteus]
MNQELEIRQHNALTNARYEYTELQLDLFFFIISKLRKDEKDTIYQLDIRELSSLTGKRYNGAYLHKATADMGSRMLEVEDAKEYRQIWMFQQIRYIKGEGIIEFDLTKYVLPYLFQLKNNFTSYELAAALRLTSKYAKRIYQICSQWKDLGETKKYDLQDFKKMLGLLDEKGNEKMERISQLREKVLDVAVKQINEHTELNVSYTLEKRGKTFKNITFTVKPQALAETIPFDLEPGAVSPAGLAPHQVENARRLLTQLSITTPELVATILASAAHVAACNKFAHDLKTGKHAKAHSLSGLLLTILGLKKPANGPLFDAATKK